MKALITAHDAISKAVIMDCLIHNGFIALENVPGCAKYLAATGLSAFICCLTGGYERERAGQLCVCERDSNYPHYMCTEPYCSVSYCAANILLPLVFLPGLDANLNSISPYMVNIFTNPYFCFFSFFSFQLLYKVYISSSTGQREGGERRERRRNIMRHIQCFLSKDSLASLQLPQAHRGQCFSPRLIHLHTFSLVGNANHRCKEENTSKQQQELICRNKETYCLNSECQGVGGGIKPACPVMEHGCFMSCNCNYPSVIQKDLCYINKLLINVYRTTLTSLQLTYRKTRTS